MAMTIAPTAVIIRDGALLLAQRLPDASFGRLWETPGGKSEPGEREEPALHRELGEELGVACGFEIGEQIARLYLAPPVTSQAYDIPIFRVQLIGDPQPLAATQLCWYPLALLPRLVGTAWITPATRVAIAAIMATDRSIAALCPHEPVSTP